MSYSSSTLITILCNIPKHHQYLILESALTIARHHLLSWTNALAIVMDLMPLQILMLSFHIIRDLPAYPFPSTHPSMITFSRLLECLFICPKTRNFRFFTCFSNYLSVPNCCKIHSFVLCCR